NQGLLNLLGGVRECGRVPWSRARGMPRMAYSPIEQGRLARNAHLEKIAARHGAAPAQVALAWVLAQQGVIAIPKAASPEHVRQNVAAAQIALTNEDTAELDRAFPPPTRKRPLEMI